MRVLDLISLHVMLGAHRETEVHCSHLFSVVVGLGGKDRGRDAEMDRRRVFGRAAAARMRGRDAENATEAAATWLDGLGSV